MPFEVDGEIVFANILLKHIPMKRLISLFLVVFALLNYAFAQGKLWGLLPREGSSNAGEIFRMNGDGTSFVVQKEFATNFNGKNPNLTSLTEVAGKFYGVTYAGGKYSSGTVFEYNPSTGSVVSKYDFNQYSSSGVTGNHPFGGVTLANNGKLYGTTQNGGTLGYGVIFEFDLATNVFTKRYDFNNTNGGTPYAKLLLGANGKLYGTTQNGGPSAYGVLFEFDPSTNTYTKLHDFTGTATGRYPQGQLVQTANGKLYGATLMGGVSDGGAIFQYDISTNSTIKVQDLYRNPHDLMLASNGKIYGLTEAGGSSYGTLFEFDPSTNTGVDKVVFSNGTNGYEPEGGLTQSSNGKLYGTTTRGGANDAGVLFEYDPTTNAYLKKVDFTISNGKLPQGVLLKASNGMLYGLTMQGGVNNSGVIFEYDAGSNTFTKKIDLSYSPDGAYPLSSLTRIPGGKTYGVTSSGGANGLGTLFEYDAVTGNLISLVQFSGTANGAEANGKVVQGANGNLYGMTYRGGLNNLGVLYEYNLTTNVFQKKIDFAGSSNGSYPNGSLTLAPNGKIYGLTSTGGVNDKGVLFEYDPSTGILTKKLDFDGTNGQSPINNLSLANGKFYGMTFVGGATSNGVLFEYDYTNNIYTKKYDFGSTGRRPSGDLTLGRNGKFYGVTSQGGPNGDVGTIFEYDPVTNSYLTKLDFNTTPFQYPCGTLTEAADGKFYGRTLIGGLPLSNSYGILFEYSVATNTLSKKADYYSEASNGPGMAFHNPSLFFLKDNQTISFAALPTKVFGDAAFSPGATASSGLPITYASSNPSVATVSGGVVTIVGAGTTVITASQIGDVTYNPADDVQQTLTVNKAVLTATSDAKSKIYGDANPTFTITYTGFKGTDNSSVIDTQPSLSTTATATSNVGTYPITPAGGTDNNYTFTLVNGTLSVTQAPLTATADVKSKIYGDVNPTFTITYTGFKGTDNSSVIDTQPSSSTTATVTSNVGTYPITLTGGTDNNYTLTLVNNTLTVTQAPLTATADPKTKLYGDVNPAFTITYTGFKGTDNSSVIDTQPSSSTTATVTSNVGTYPITLAGGTDNNYALTLVNGVLTVNKATLTATSDAKSKIYGDANPAFTITYAGFKGTDNSSVIDTPPSSSTTATTTSNVGTYAITLAGGIDNNYLFSLVNGTLTVTQAPLTATADAKSKIYGDANPAFTITYTGFKGTDNSSVIDTQPSSSTTATTTSNVGTYPITLAGGLDNNYALTLVAGILSVNKATLTATADPNSKIYGDANPTFTVTYTGFKGTDNASVIDTQPSLSTTATVTSNVGTYPITLTGGTDNNYTLTLVNGVLTVNKATLTATSDAKSKIYGDANPAFTITYTGFKGTDNSSVIDTQPSSSTTATATSNVGTYPITLAGGIDNNYLFSLVNGTLTVTQAPLTATADVKSKIYGDVNPTFTITYTGFKGTDNSSVIDTQPSSSTTATATSNVGTYPITLTGGADNNYTLALVNNTLTVTQAPLTATADPKTKLYGDLNPAFTITYTGFKGTDNSSVIDTQPSSSTTATVTSNVGTYPITLAGGTDNNYALTLVNGVLTVNKATLTATSDAKSKIYGDANPTFTITYTGFKGTDNSSVIDAQPSSSTTATATSNVGTYPITLAGGIDNNYLISLVNGTLTVTQAPLTATADPKSKIYGDANPTFTITYTGFKGTDNSSVIDTQPSSSTTATTTSNVGTYTITLTGGTDNNYSLSLVNGTLTITKASLTANADAKTKVYGDVNPTLTITYSGFKGTDSFIVIDTQPSSSTTAGTTSNVGTYPITLTGGIDNNYTLTLVNSTLTINKAPLTATADAKTKLYGDANPTFSITYSGFKGTDDATVIDVQPSSSTTATSSSNVGNYPITLTGGTDNNYGLTLVNNTISVTKATLTVTADPKARAYASLNPQLTFTYSGFIGTEDATVLDAEPSISTIATITSNVGSYPITLTGGSDNNYAYSLVPGTLTIYKEEQTITFGPLADKTVGDGQFILFAVGGPTGNPVTFSSMNPAVVSVFGNVATVVGTGTTIITASQAGNLNYNAASSVTQSITVNPAGQTITFNGMVTKKFGDAAFNPGAISSSGLAVTYTSSDPAVATISSNNITIVGVGTAIITAKQAGNANYSAAADVSQSLVVIASPVVVSPLTPTVCLGTGTALTATGAATYSWSPSTGLSSTSGISVIASPLITTTYTITGTYANGAITTATATVKVNAMPLAAGGSHSVIKYCGSCGGYVTTNGLNTSGQLGDGSTTQRISPVTLSLTTISAVAAGTSHSLFLKDNGTVWASGLNTNGQLGDGSIINRPSPVQVSGLTGIIAVSAGNTHSLFLKNDGTVWACGINSNGQLGDGTTVQKNTPVQVSGLTGIIKISAGGLHSLFLKNDGTVWACGRNANGQLGDGTTIGKPTSVLISSLSGITEISAGGTHSQFLKNNGTVWATGLNTNGQLGNGTTTQRTTPSALATINFVTAISAGATHTLFLRNDGTAWSCGLNTNGQLGDGTTTQAITPVLVSTLNGVTALDAGATHSLFLTNDGTVWASGLNANGQLGDGTTTGRLFPVQTVNVSPCGRVRSVEQPVVIAKEKVNFLETYPNPVDGELTINLLQGAPVQIIPLTLFDGFGKAVIQDQINSGEATKNLNTKELSAGMYFLKMKTEHGDISRKVMIVH
jgi:uncharacterized repeat protein (TIGR03803 family)